MIVIQHIRPDSALVLSSWRDTNFLGTQATWAERTNPENPREHPGKGATKTKNGRKEGKILLFGKAQLNLTGRIISGVVVVSLFVELVALAVSTLSKKSAQMWQGMMACERPVRPRCS